MGGPSPISMSELDAWQRVHGVRLTAWELEVIRAFDGAYMEAARKAKQ